MSRSLSDIIKIILCVKFVSLSLVTGIWFLLYIKIQQSILYIDIKFDKFLNLCSCIDLSSARLLLFDAITPVISRGFSTQIIKNVFLCQFVFLSVLLVALSSLRKSG